MTANELKEKYSAGERDFQGANLRRADLRRANLSGADLDGANLSGAVLREAVLDGANLIGANLIGANLIGANLIGAKINWQSHDLVAEILRAAAGDNLSRRSIAGLVLVSRDLCWDVWRTAEHPEREWAIEVLSRWERFPLAKKIMEEEKK